MSDTVNNKEENGAPPSLDTIEAVQFRPSTAAKESRFGIWHYLIAVAASIALFIFWFIFTTRSVAFDFTPNAENIAVSGGLSFELANVLLLREGEYTITATTDLHEPFEETIIVGPEANQTFAFSFIPLPGFLTIDPSPSDALIEIDGVPVNNLELIELKAGQHEVSVSHPRYQPTAQIVDITGKQEQQQLAVELDPNWSDVSISTIPVDADILIDGELWPSPTPATIEALAGEREITIRKEGFKTHRQRIFAQAMQPMSLEPVTLVQADAQLRVTTSPTNAGVLVNGQFMGQSPIELDLKSGTNHNIQAVKAGYATVRRSVQMNRGERDTLSLNMTRQTGLVTVTAVPAEAELWIDGQRSGTVNRTLTLPIRAHEVEIRLAGYAGYKQSITPKTGLTQEIKVKLLTIEEARLAAMKPSIKAPDGQALLLFQPTDFKMGASRREPGRRANETLRDVAMSHLFYLATHETTNAQFRKFAKGHDSGKYVETTLNEDEQPVANLSWHDAAAYCNWLSDQEGLPPFYNIEFGKVVSTNPSAIGYRLPSEAEWSWAARTFDVAPNGDQPDQLRFPWGQNLPPPERHGNYADRAASSLVGRVIFGYNDNYAASSPIGTYKANHRSLYDMGGNVAEWMNDYYEIPKAETVSDPKGPRSGEYHVIKGSSWMHGTISELRYSFRDYGIDGRQDVGFRIARYVEPPK